MLKNKNRERNLSPEEKIFFFKRLAVYMASGISLPRAIYFLSNETPSRACKAMYADIEALILQGEALHTALASYPRDFDGLLIGLTEAAEASGTLSSTFLQISDVLEKKNGLNSKIVSALLYPSIVGVGTIAVSLFLLLVIFPKILPVLQGLHTALPFTTRVMIGLYSFVQHEWLLLIIACMCLVLGSIWSYRFKRVRVTYERLLITLPVIGTIYSYYMLSSVFFLLDKQLSSGIRVLPALALIQRSTPSMLYGSALSRIQDKITEGRRLSVALGDEKLLFPLVATQLLAAGEETGTLRENCEALGELFQERLSDLTRNLTLLIEPVLMVYMGILVGFIALAIITPIYAVTQSIRIQ